MKAKDKTYMSVGVMEDYKLRELRSSHTLVRTTPESFVGYAEVQHPRL